MRDEFANRQSMHLTVLNLLLKPESKAVWEGNNPVKFTEKAGIFRTKATALTGTIAEKTKIITGEAEEKDREEDELEVIAQEYGSVFAEYLNDLGREGEAAEFELSLSGWQGLRDTVLLAKATLLKTRLTAALAADAPGLAGYGITPADLVLYTKELADYEKVIQNPSGAIATRKALTAALRPDFREVLNILLSMDRLVLRFRGTPEGKAFAANWKTARIVRDLGGNNPDPEPPTP